jgi:hypothetical protein
VLVAVTSTGIDVCVGIFVTVGCGGCVYVRVGVGFFGVVVLVGVGLPGSFVGVTEGVFVGVTEGVFVGVTEGVFVGVLVGVIKVLVDVGVLVEVAGVKVGVASPLRQWLSSIW